VRSPSYFRCVTKLHQISLLARKNHFLFFHLFATSYIQVPNGFPLITPFFYVGTTQDGNWKHFGCHQRGENEEGKKTKGVGGGERHCGDHNVFDCHTIMVTKNLSVTTIAIQQHWLNSVAIGQWLCVSVTKDGYASKFGHHMGIIRWWPNLS